MGVDYDLLFGQAVARPAAANLRRGDGGDPSPEDSKSERERHQDRAARVKCVLSAAGLPLIQSDTHIVPLMVGDPERCKAASDMLLAKYGIYLQPINYPTVPRAWSGCASRPTPGTTMR